jgi:FlaA1/EpsC-like NDP-sugar epimerase
MRIDLSQPGTLVRIGALTLVVLVIFFYASRSASRVSCSTTPWVQQVATVREDLGGKRVLVTGAAGFIGSHVAEFCAKSLGFSVWGIVFWRSWKTS